MIMTNRVKKLHMENEKAQKTLRDTIRAHEICDAVN